MFEATTMTESNEPQPTDPPTSTSGGGSTPRVESTADETLATDPPENSGGGSA